MNYGTVDYRDVLGAVNNGIFVAFAAGTCGGEPTLAWVATALPARSVEHAYHRDQRIRAAQAVGAISELRRSASKHGFIPA